ncbi:MAG: hypothetical protein KC443_06940 [Anaerolineales bacterium]|nr:hypothetical protein [Anaerolineales bacterium]MCB8968959.1 hypothetical protein [Ardenticatenaceae bacterium]
MFNQKNLVRVLFVVVIVAILAFALVTALNGFTVNVAHMSGSSFDTFMTATSDGQILGTCTASTACIIGS